MSRLAAILLVVVASSCRHVRAPKAAQLTNGIAVTQTREHVDVGPYSALPTSVRGEMNVLKDADPLTALSCANGGTVLQCTAGIGYSLSMRVGKGNTASGTARLGTVMLDLNTSAGPATRRRGSSAYHLYDNRKRWVATFTGSSAYFSDEATEIQRDAAALTVLAVVGRSAAAESEMP